MAIESTMYKNYTTTIRNQLKEELKLSSVMATPKLSKVVINMGLGEATGDKSVIKEGLDELTRISGQHAVATKSKKSNASFKIREDMAIGVKVTLRGQKMYDFLEKLINISLPRIRDFRGLSPRSFDGRGNYSLGVKEIIIFPEIELDKIKTMKGCDISIVSTSQNDEYMFKLLEKLGFPFNGTFKGGK